jgi:hypothetical protein
MRTLGYFFSAISTSLCFHQPNNSRSRAKLWALGGSKTHRGLQAYQ